MSFVPAFPEGGVGAREECEETGRKVTWRFLFETTVSTCIYSAGLMD